ncbi:MAG: hypothetical protein WBG86_07610, partial [Polyangiales bacterium]
MVHATLFVGLVAAPSAAPPATIDGGVPGAESEATNAADPSQRMGRQAQQIRDLMRRRLDVSVDPK